MFSMLNSFTNNFFNDYPSITNPGSYDPYNPLPTPGNNNELVIYTNNEIGISIVMPDTWEAIESAKYPDEVLGLYPLVDSGTRVWIDRYPTLTVEDFHARIPGIFTIYTAGQTATFNIVSQCVEVINGTDWQLVIFTITDYADDLFVELYVTDMPNQRGLFMYAVIMPLHSNDYTDNRIGLEMLDSLIFIK